MIPGKSVPGRGDRQCTGSGAESGASKQRGGVKAEATEVKRGGCRDGKGSWVGGLRTCEGWRRGQRPVGLQGQC